MDEAEARAEQYLQHSGFTDIEREPEGYSKFPDFRVNARIGVEVCRLKISTADRADRAALSACRKLPKLLSDFGPPINGVSWFVGARFRRPLIKWAKLKQQIQDRLRLFQDAPLDQATLEVNANFGLCLIRASNTQSCCFLYGGFINRDNGVYFVEYERKRNLDLCIGAKTEKRNKAVLRHEYSQWWLIF